MEEQKKQEKKIEVSYPREEALVAATEYFKGDDLAAGVWLNKYALKDSDGNIYEKTPNDMHRRIAKEIARVESKYENPMHEEQIYKLLEGFKYIVPQGGPMAGIGNTKQIVSLSNCFVIGNEGKSDSYGGILKIDQEQVQLMKRRGGVGHDLSHIRPSGTAVKNSALTSTGVVPFMERYSNSTREVAQDGRRGALMLSTSIRHPDSESFIDAKMESGKVTGANISVKVHDDFMQAAIQGSEYTQQYPIESNTPTFTKNIDAKKLFDKIIHNAWKSAEPGVLFWDTIKNESIPDCYADLGYETVSTNPCGEIPLCPYDSCRLLAMNLFSYVENPFTKEARFNEKLFREHVQYAQRIMDDIIDLELEKIDAILSKIDKDPESDEVKRIERNLWVQIQKKAKEGRRTGVGITAEGDALAALGYRYGSDEAIDFAVNKIHKQLALAAYRQSVTLAKERGPFKVYNSQREENNPMIKRIKGADPELYEDMVKYGRRNIAALTIAPTGTVSLMTQTTSGIEPVFLPTYKRRKKINPNDKNARTDFVDEVGDHWEEHIVFHHKFVDWMVANNIDTTQNFSQEELDELVRQSPYNKATSNDVDYIQKVKMQGRIQKWVDHSISVTVNLPKDVSESTVREVYIEAWKSGCKGVTVYRDGSRSGVLVSGKAENKPQAFPKKRPESLNAEVLRFINFNSETNEAEKWIGFIGLFDGRPYEFFAGLDDDSFLAVPRKITKGKIIKRENGKKHYDFEYETAHGFTAVIPGISYQFNPEFWNYAKLISGTLRHGMPVEKVVELVKGLNLKGEGINTWKSGVERALKKYIPNGTKANGKEKCQECGSTDLIYQEGCLVCKSCGCGKCG